MPAYPPSTLNAARIYSGNMVHCIRGTIRSTQTGTSVELGTIPAGSYVFGCIIHITTLFAGGTPAVDIGSSADPDGFMTTAVVIPGTAGIKSNFGGALSTGAQLGDLLTADTVVYATLSASLTAGAASVTVLFYPHTT